uniref:Uncharacterized protein n=1 Tax=Anguilla anguilla TaxID=7936 RepID=A0A0E9UZ01_ANGAN
MPQCSDRDTVL